MGNVIREAFERVTYPTLSVTGHGLRRRLDTGEYFSVNLEDHWQTFQEGWEEAIKYLKSKDNGQYSDIVSDSW